jgi:hypothetical protein
VVSVTPGRTSFTFTVVSNGYFDAPGSQITFSLSQSRGDLYLTQHAEAKHSKIAVQVMGALQYTRSVWLEQAHNLRTLLGVQPSRPSVNWANPLDWIDLVGGNWDHWF